MRLTSYIMLSTVLAMTACITAQPDPGWTRWGITKGDAPPEIEAELAKGYRQLYQERNFEEAYGTYHLLSFEHPGVAEVRHGLSMALRYRGFQQRAIEEVRKALEIDPEGVAPRLNYADLLSPYRGAPLPDSEPMSDAKRTEEAIRIYQGVLEADHPLAAYARIGLWALYFFHGELTGARAQLVALHEAGYFPKMVVNLAYNLLVGLGDNAILFTNGDNDTHPLLMLQAAEGFRQDVTVVNLALLNLNSVTSLLRDSLGLPISYDDAELASLKQRPDSTLRRDWLPADDLVADILEQAEAAGRPVYFALTTSLVHRQLYMDRAVLEGLVWRIEAEPAVDSVDYERIEQNLTGRYRLEGLGEDEPWPSNLSPLTRRTVGLVINYAALYDKLAEYYKSVDDRAAVVRCYQEVYRLVEAAGRTELLGSVLDQWLEYSPGDAEASSLKKRLEPEQPEEEQ